MSDDLVRTIRERLDYWREKAYEAGSVLVLNLSETLPSGTKTVFPLRRPVAPKIPLVDPRSSGSRCALHQVRVPLPTADEPVSMKSPALAAQLFERYGRAGIRGRDDGLRVVRPDNQQAEEIVKVIQARQQAAEAAA